MLLAARRYWLAPATRGQEFAGHVVQVPLALYCRRAAVQPMDALYAMLTLVALEMMVQAEETPPLTGEDVHRVEKSGSDNRLIPQQKSGVGPTPLHTGCWTLKV